MTSRARLIVERMTRSLVYRRHLPPEDGGAPVFVSPSAGLRYLFRPMRQVDPRLLANARTLVQPNDVVWDIGANIGLFAIAAAARAGRGGQVVAFEPDTWLVELLARSVALQPPASAPILVVPVAVAAAVALRRFLIARRSRASNALAGHGHSQAGGVAETRMVPTFPLDWLLDHLPAPSVVKCDVEGAEAEVFRGQTALLTKIRPTILCEVGEPAAEAVTEIFRVSGYRLFDGDAEAGRLAATQRATWNTIAIPEEKVEKVDKATAGARGSPAVPEAGSVPKGVRRPTARPPEGD